MSTSRAGRYSVSEVARMVGVSPSTLRAWEQYGLVRSTRNDAGWRRYDHNDITRAREVHRLREVEGLAVHAIRRRLHGGRSRARARGASLVPGSAVGSRLREKRNESAYSLRALAAAAGVSPSLVSGVERGVVQPSLASLQKLSAALGTSVAELVAVPAPACQLVGGEVTPLDLPVPGVRIEDLAGGARLLEPQRFSVDPGRGSGGEYAHDGEEFLYVIEGMLAITLDGREHFDVDRGMSLCFDSTRRHRWWNPGSVVTKVLWINTPRSF
ncbi:MAG: helix-turn-helix domain-containing protein [Candidatus Dormibacteraeota bacterium]|nr:helix-turn-helix domain-containing protein [Candidatus Dormibacteraeota bacterium]